MNYRPEIDGLRAIAVIPVILFHAGFELFSGGFVGVDVFFVISGYLITTIIISELIEGRFNVVNFYERRARRILPALIFVTATCIPFAWLWLPPNDLKDFGQSLVAVSTFSSNILFWWESGYFENAAELKPLLHMWSLAVEEQYYIIFPIFLILTYRFGIKLILILLSILCFISFSLAVLGSQYENHPKTISGTFFLLPSRGWEIIIGVFVALYLKYKRHLKSYFVNQVLSLLGFGMIIFSIIAFDETTPFPSLYTLIPTIGTGLLIMCAVPKTFIHKFLNLKIFVGVGLISYSAYLWHQPLFAFVRQLSLGEISELILIFLCFTSFLLAWLSWRFVEKPFRNKSTIGRKNFFAFSFLSLFLFIFFGSYLHLKEGFRHDRYELIYQHLTAIGIKNYEINNEYLKEESWKILREMYKNKKYGVDNNIIDKFNNFGLSSSTKRVLLVGNSHSKDLFNVFYHSDETRQSLNFARYGIQLADIDYEFYKSQAYENSQAIILVSRYDKKDLSNLYDLAKKIVLDGKKLFIVESIFNFPIYGSGTLADFVLEKSLQELSSVEEYTTKTNKLYTEYFLGNESTKNFHAKKQIFEQMKKKIEKDYPQVTFLNRNDIVCPKNFCYGVTPDGQKTFYDYGHHTLAGSKFFGKNLHKTKFFRDLIKGMKD